MPKIVTWANAPETLRSSTIFDDVFRQGSGGYRGGRQKARLANQVDAVRAAKGPNEKIVVGVSELCGEMGLRAGN